MVVPFHIPVLIVPDPLQREISPFPSLYVFILTARWNLTVVLFWITMMISIAEYLSYVYCLCFYFLLKCTSKIFLIFTAFFVFYYWIVEALYLFWIKSLTKYMTFEYFLLVYLSPIHSLNAFQRTKFLILIKPNLLFFFLCLMLFVPFPKIALSLQVTKISFYGFFWKLHRLTI